MDEGGNNVDGVRDELYQVDLVEVQEPVEEVIGWDPKSTLDVHEEDDGLPSPLGGERLAGRWPPSHLHLGL